MSVDDSADFSKQRRNLIIISGVLILHDVLGVNYEDFKLFGMQITKGENIAWVIWIMWIYFLIRYFNLFFEQDRKYKSFFSNTYKNTIHKHYCKKFSKKHPDVNGSFKVNYDLKRFFKHHLTYVHPIDSSKNTTYHVNCKRFYFDLRIFFISLFKNKAFFEYYFPIIFALVPAIINLNIFVSWCLK